MISTSSPERSEGLGREQPSEHSTSAVAQPHQWVYMLTPKTIETKWWTTWHNFHYDGLSLSSESFAAWRIRNQSKIHNMLWKAVNSNAKYLQSPVNGLKSENMVRIDLQREKEAPWFSVTHVFVCMCVCVRCFIVRPGVFAMTVGGCRRYFSRLRPPTGSWCTISFVLLLLLICLNLNTHTHKHRITSLLDVYMEEPTEVWSESLNILLCHLVEKNYRVNTPVTHSAVSPIHPLFLILAHVCSWGITNVFLHRGEEILLLPSPQLSLSLPSASPRHFSHLQLFFSSPLSRLPSPSLLSYPFSPLRYWHILFSLYPLRHSHACTQHPPNRIPIFLLCRLAGSDDSPLTHTHVQTEINTCICVPEQSATSSWLLQMRLCLLSLSFYSFFGLRLILQSSSYCPCIDLRGSDRASHTSVGWGLMV